MAARARSRFDQDDYAPRSDVYTGLLALSLVAMIVSCLLLFLDYSQYGSMKAPNVSIPQPKGREGVATGQLPPPLIHLPPPAPVGERPFTRGTATAANPVKPVGGGEEAQAPVVVPAPAPEPPAPAGLPVPPPVEVPPTPVAPAPTPAVPPAPAPEPVAPPPAPAPSPPAATNPPPAPAPTPVPPPLPKSIRSLPN
jgi:hypothetical protein